MVSLHVRVIDPLHDYFCRLFENVGLNDIIPTFLFPTWLNGRLGNVGIAKRLDNFFMKDILCHTLERLKSWTIDTGVSNYKDVVLEMDSERNLKGYPFKFNSVFLEDDSFCNLVKTKWKELSSLVLLPPMVCFIKKLALL